jgi:hypothetical protein
MLRPAETTQPDRTRSGTSARLRTEKHTLLARIGSPRATKPHVCLVLIVISAAKLEIASRCFAA